MAGFIAGFIKCSVRSPLPGICEVELRPRALGAAINAVSSGSASFHSFCFALYFLVLV